MRDFLSGPLIEWALYADEMSRRSERSDRQGIACGSRVAKLRRSRASCQAPGYSEHLLIHQLLGFGQFFRRHLRDNAISNYLRVNPCLRCQPTRME
jgi:hypothetical protein